MNLKMMGTSRSVVVWGTLVALAWFLVGAAPCGAAGEAEKGALSGFVYAKDNKTPVAGAVVKVRNTADLKELASQPTDANGMYRLAGLPEGRYVLGISAGKDDFNLDYVVYVKAGELGKLSVSLAAAGGGAQDEPAPPTKKKGFFSTLAGRALVVAAVGVGLYFLIVEPESSPIR